MVVLVCSLVTIACAVSSSVILSPLVEKATVDPSVLTNVNVSSRADAVNEAQAVSDNNMYLSVFLFYTKLYDMYYM